MKRICLNGNDWEIKGYLGDDWMSRRAYHPESRDRLGWVPAQVPGSVLNDLWQAGEVPNPYFERNSLLVEWVPQRAWVYRKVFEAPEALEGQRLRLWFEGIDYEALVYLNGEELGTHRGMYSPAAFEITGRLRIGKPNLLAVVVLPSPDEQTQVGRTSRVRTHKARMNYWWDFCPRMVHQGIWDGVWIEASGPARIEDLFVRPQLSEDLQHAELRVCVEVASVVETAGRLDLVIRDGDRTVAERQIPVDLSEGANRFKACLDVPEPNLWWPNGAGEQPLYKAEARLSLAGSQGEVISDTRAVTFGIRKVEMIPNEGAEACARPYTLVVNGHKLYINGWNWVPMDALYGVERPEKLNRLIDLAREAHVNLLRVWGGGLIEKESFYNLCDRMGLLVWQEFIQSSSGIDNSPADDPSTVAMLVREARQIIPRRRNHASLALWCGGNELQSGPEMPLDERHPALAALKKVVEELDPDRLWLPTSPTGRVFGNTLEALKRDPSGMHDVHGPWEHQGLAGQPGLYNQGVSLLHSEFGVEGITNMPALRATVSPERRLPVSLANPVWRHLGAWWVKEATWQAAFGEVESLEKQVRAAQLLQADGLRYAVEADRRRQFHNAGTLPWQFNEPYPMAACTSAVDYFAMPKPAYYAVAGAYEPVHVSARYDTQAWAGREVFEAQVWGSNAREVMFEGRLKSQVVGLDGTVYWEQGQEVRIVSNTSVQLQAVQLKLAEVTSDIFFLDVTLEDLQGEQLSSNRYLFSRRENLAPLWQAPHTSLVTHWEMDGDNWELTLQNEGGSTALYVWLADARPAGTEGWPYLSANHFCLFPGERRTVTVGWEGVEPDERSLAVGGWNTPAYRVPDQAPELLIVSIEEDGRHGVA